ncbi:MAG: hypothetical protein IJ104_10345, partial [Methanobrevibacter sp.]|nr:hypothetical protein [Methanobrevibacter sp.]
GTLANSTFNNCSVNNNGGAVYWNAVNGTITDSNFINCSANKGGALIWFRENGNLSSSNFTDCSATTEGGAVYFNGENGTVNDSNFTDCSANDGGAVYWFGSDGTLSNYTFDNCSADSDGGAVNWDGVNGTLTDSNFTDCSAGTDGGAVMWFGDDGTLANSTFINNTAKRDGGAVEWDGDNGNLINSNFTDNTANGNGGAVYWYGDNGTLSGSNFTDCSAVNGGAIYWDSEDGLINDSYFDDNTGNWRNIYLTNPDDVTVSNNTFADTVATIKLNSKIIYGNNETFNGTYDTGVNINKTMNYTVNTTAEYYDLNVTLTGNVDEEVYSNYNVTKPNVGWHEIILGNTDTFNNVYLFSKPDGIFEVIKANSSVEVGDDEVQYNGTANVTLTVTNATDIKVTIKDSKGNNITSTVNIVVDEDYTYILVGNLPSGNYTINVTAVPDDNHNPSSDVGDIKVLPAPSVVIVGNDTIVYDSTANVTVSVVNGTFTKDDVKIFKDDVEITNATVDVVDDIIYVSGLDVGNYTVYVTSTVDENHTSATSSGWINVTKANSTVAFNNTTVVYGDEITIPVVTENSTAGPVIVTVKDKDNNTVDVTVIDDVIVLPENIDVGVYNVVVTTNVTGNYNNATS